MKHICKYCGKTFDAKRADSVRCKKCHTVRRKQCQAQPAYRKARSNRYALLRKAVIEGYGGKCDCCGETRFEFLSIDHKNGGGNADRKIRSIHQIMKAIVAKDFPDTYRILCHNCNCAIGFYGYCPHKRTA